MTITSHVFASVFCIVCLRRLTRDNVPDFDNPPVQNTPDNDHVQSDGPAFKGQRVPILRDDQFITDSRDRNGLSPERALAVFSDCLEEGPDAVQPHMIALQVRQMGLKKCQTTSSAITSFAAARLRRSSRLSSETLGCASVIAAHRQSPPQKNGAIRAPSVFQ